MQSHLQLGNILLQIGEVDEALYFAQKAVNLAPESPLPVYSLCFSLAAAGKTDDVVKIIADWEGRAEKEYVPPYFIGMSHLAIGNFDTAFNFFEKSMAEHSAWVLWYGTEPKMDSIRNDPRYIELLRATKNPIIDSLTKKRGRLETQFPGGLFSWKRFDSAVD